MSEDDVSDAEPVEMEQHAPQDMVLNEDSGELVYPGVILATLREEVEQYKAKLATKSDVRRHNGRYGCDLCPIRSFKELRALRVHVCRSITVRRTNSFVRAPSESRQYQLFMAIAPHRKNVASVFCGQLRM